jgi:hypothetical protein
MTDPTSFELKRPPTGNGYDLLAFEQRVTLNPGRTPLRDRIRGAWCLLLGRTFTVTCATLTRPHA